MRRVEVAVLPSPVPLAEPPRWGSVRMTHTLPPLPSPAPAHSLSVNLTTLGTSQVKIPTEFALLCWPHVTSGFPRFEGRVILHGVDAPHVCPSISWSAFTCVASTSWLL